MVSQEREESTMFTPTSTGILIDTKRNTKDNNIGNSAGLCPPISFQLLALVLHNPRQNVEPGTSNLLYSSLGGNVLALYPSRCSRFRKRIERIS